MQIKELTITDKELNQAVKEFLLNRFEVNVDVKSVEKRYSHQDFYIVEVGVIEKLTPVEPPSLQQIDEEERQSVLDQTPQP